MGAGVRFTPADEGRHDGAPGVEGWLFELESGRATGRIGLFLDLEHGQAGFLTDLVVGGVGRVVVADDSVPVPRRAAGLEIRAEGLWASLWCETPFEHWSLGLEAFGLEVDSDADVASSWSDLRGERVPVGFDLEWELRAAPEPLADGAGYRQEGSLFGVVVVERTRVEIDTPASRAHWWGRARTATGGQSPSSATAKRSE
jgi:hypothetical protein